MRQPSLRPFNDHDLLKVIATLSMVVDHIGLLFLPQYPILRVIGRMAAPLFCFLVGYTGSKRLPNLMIVYGIVLTMMSYLLGGKLYVNILLTFTLMRISFDWIDYTTLSSTRLILLSGIFIALYLIGLERHWEYACTGVLIGIAARRLAAGAPQARGFLIAIMGFYWLAMLMQFHFWRSEALWLPHTLIVIGVTALMLLYRANTTSTRLQNPWLKCLSHYSLHVYFWHLFTMQCILLLIMIQLA